MRYHGWSKSVLVSHSYGSIIAARLLKSDRFAPLIGPAHCWGAIASPWRAKSCGSLVVRERRSYIAGLVAATAVATEALKPAGKRGTP
ncbi:transcriptional regulator family: Fungal Specific TF [Penicillium desertorum]|uniref:Transcriptional regulator family: Fungal Specific TF n=1 Tax=Penicillium desertorum TaxID=1303715 RepID=A0A9X0BLH3_9EURO|nr:transcriptional regulator family: Fungal Specific TF [Penicillium desertorum]